MKTPQAKLNDVHGDLIVALGLLLQGKLNDGVEQIQHAIKEIETEVAP